MNPNHPNYEVAKAWVEGAVIEYRLNKSGNWCEVDYTAFAEHNLYRVKVQAKRQPTPQEVLDSHVQQLMKFKAALEAEHKRSNQVCTALRLAINNHNTRYHKFLSSYQKVHGHV